MTTVPDALLQLNAALDGLAAALQSGDPDAVLSAELPLSAAVEALANLNPSSVAPGPVLAARLLDTRLAVARCIRLGKTSADLLTMVTGQPSYGPAGRPVTAAAAGPYGRHPELACRA